MVIGKTKQTKVWALPRRNRRKNSCRPDQTDKNCHWPDGGRDPIFFPDHWFELYRTLVHDPNQSGQHLFWVVDFIMGRYMIHRSFEAWYNLKFRKHLVIAVFKCLRDFNKQSKQNA